MTEPLQTIEPHRFVLEQGKPFSQSFIWKLQRAFFEQQGNQAWSEGIVPHYITSNPYMANAYAALVLGWLRDWRAGRQDDSSVLHGRAGDLWPPAGRLDLARPLYIVELGAGHGRFAYHFLKKFEPRWRRSPFSQLPIRYIMTDLAEKNIAHWRGHALLRPFVEKGMLDFARFDAEQPAPLALLESGETLSAETLCNPIVVFANYFFDSISQDSFACQQGELYENAVTVTSPLADPDLSDPAVLETINLSEEKQVMQPDYYADPDWNRLLRAYQETLPDTVIGFPTAALACLRFFREASHGRLLLLSADKGYIRDDALVDPKPPDPVHHGAAFSLSVNYHALAEYTKLHAGLVLQPAHTHANILVCAFLMGGPECAMPETCLAFDDVIELSGPDEFYSLLKALQGKYETMTAPQLLAVLRLSGWDTHLFMDMFMPLLEKVGGASEMLKRELRAAAGNLYDMYYPIGEARDVPFHLGTLLYSIESYGDAIMYFQHSLDVHGPNRSTWHNMGMSYYRLRRLGDALRCMNELLALDLNYSPAKSMRIKLQAEIQEISR